MFSLTEQVVVPQMLLVFTRKPDNSFSFDLSVLSNHPENSFNPKGSLFHSFIGVYK